MVVKTDETWLLQGNISKSESSWCFAVIYEYHKSLSKVLANSGNQKGLYCNQQQGLMVMPVWGYPCMVIPPTIPKWSYGNHSAMYIIYGQPLLTPWCFKEPSCQFFNHKLKDCYRMLDWLCFTFSDDYTCCTDDSSAVYQAFYNRNGPHGYRRHETSFTEWGIQQQTWTLHMSIWLMVSLWFSIFPGNNWITSLVTDESSNAV